MGAVSDFDGIDHPVPDQFVLGSPGRAVYYHWSVCKRVRAGLSNRYPRKNNYTPFNEVSDRTVEIADLIACPHCGEVAQ